MQKGYKFRIYPNESEKVLLAKTFGCCRKVWNECLARAIQEYEAYKLDSSLPKPKVTGYSFNYQVKYLRQKFEYLQEVSYNALQQQTLDLGKAFTNFFNGKGYPKFKKKSNHQSFRLMGDRFKIDGRYLYLQKYRIQIKMVLDREIPSDPSSLTISQTPSGEYYVSFVCEVEPKLTYGKGRVGVDVGLTHFATLSTGEKIPNPRYYIQLQRKLGQAQRQLSRKVKGSNNRNKARLKVAKIHQRIANQRKDFLHKITRQLIDENQVISIEDLAVGNMIKNRRLSKSIADVGWGVFRQFLEYKAVESGHCKIMVTHRFLATSHICHVCFTKRAEKLSLKERTWQCLGCDAIHDRDGNAAKVVDYVGYTAFIEGKCDQSEKALFTFDEAVYLQ